MTLEEERDAIFQKYLDACKEIAELKLRLEQSEAFGKAALESAANLQLAAWDRERKKE